MDSWEPVLTTEGSSADDLEKCIRETALLDDEILSKKQNENEIKIESISNNGSEDVDLSIKCNLTENEMPDIDLEFHNEVDFVLQDSLRETDLTDPFEIENFQANFIDIDTSFSEDECGRISDGVSMSSEKRQSIGNSTSDENNRRSSTPSSHTSGLLKATISELERALSDTRKLLAARDEENGRLRSTNIKLYKELETERERVSELSHQISLLGGTTENVNVATPVKLQDPEKEGGDYALRETLKFLEDTLIQKDKELTDIKNEHNRNGVSKKTTKDDTRTPNATKSNCKRNCSTSSSSEVEELQNKICEQQKEISQLKEKNDSQSKNKNNELCQQIQYKEKISKLNDRDMSTQLRLKFLRDAFFYYMIDFHADEQVKAILAILEYEDKRQDIIFESHKMRQLGKKFTVTKVSSRCLTFVQEEIR